MSIRVIQTALTHPCAVRASLGAQPASFVHPWEHSLVVAAPSPKDLDDLPPAQWDALLWPVFPGGPLERLTPGVGSSMTGTSTPASMEATRVVTGRMNA